MILTESGITVDTKDFNTFKLENCKAFKQLTGLGSFKEMDIGWYNSDNDTLFLVELKEFSKVSKEEFAEKWNYEFVKKTLDCLLMTIAVQIPTQYANGLKQCFGGTDIAKIKNIKFFHIICDTRLSGREDYLIFLKDEVNKKLSPYLALFDKQAYRIFVLDCKTAKTKLDFITDCSTE